MIRFQDLNNLDEYLKKTEADNVYMKKINSIQISFTSLLTSVTNKFRYYDSEISNLDINTGLLSSSLTNLSTNIHNELTAITEHTYQNSTSLDVLNGSLSGLNSSFNILTNNFNTYTVSNDSLIGLLSSSISSLNNSVSQINGSLSLLSNSIISANNEISNLWNAIDANNGYNYWKEFNKASAETYIRYGDGKTTVLDNEGIEYKSYLSNFTLLDTNKLSYVFNSNILQTNINKSFNFGGEYNRIGLILPSEIVPMNLITATCSTLDVMLKYSSSDFNRKLYIKCLDANLINDAPGHDYNLISTNLNATAIHFNNYYKNSDNNSYSTFILNDRVQALGPWYDDGNSPHIDLRRKTYAYSHESYGELDRLAFLGLSNKLYLHNTNNGDGIGKLALSTGVNITNNRNYVFDVQIDGNNDNIVNLLNSTTGNNQSYTVTVSPYFKASTLNITIPQAVKLELNSLNSNNNNVMLGITNSNNTQSLNMASWNMSTCNLYGMPYITASYGNFGNLTIEGNTQYGGMSGLLSSITFYRNYISSYKYINSCSSILNLNNNTFLTMSVTDLGKGFSFGANFSNNYLNISAPSSATYYSYNNPNAQVVLPQGIFELLNFTAGAVTASAGGSMEKCSFNSMVINAQMGSAPYGPWKYVSVNSFTLNNALTFYQNKLCFDQAFYHCPFIQLGHTALNAAMNAEGYSCSGELMFVNNAPTTSVDFKLTGNNTSKSINARIIEDQPYIILADLRGWHPTRIIGFDQNYLFKNVATGYSALTDYKFTALVDVPFLWNAYKNFFDPFGDGRGEDRVVFVRP